MKYFAISDVHGHAKIMKRDLAKAGYDKDNPEHVLVVCGDIFDRGKEPLGVYEFLSSIPKERRILVNGNHEYLYRDLLLKDFPEDLDEGNGVTRTFSLIAGMKYKCFFRKTAEAEDYWGKVLKAVRESEVTAFMEDPSNWRDYYETESCVFVHAFVPVKQSDLFKDDPWISAMISENEGKYDPDWRNADPARWKAASWICPWQAFKKGGFKEDKKLVTGHRATEYYFYGLDGKQDMIECPLYDNGKLVGLDACTVLNKRVNVFMVEE